jgi:hypothetical protein
MPAQAGIQRSLKALDSKSRFLAKAGIASLSGMTPNDLKNL